MPDATALLAAFTFKEFFPALVLIGMLVMIFYVLVKAQKLEGFNLADMLRDERGKPSALRMAILVALSFSSWGLMALILYGQLTPEYWFWYLVTWSGSLALVKIAEAGQRWDGRLPWARSEQPPQPPPTMVTTTGQVTVGPTSESPYQPDHPQEQPR